MVVKSVSRSVQRCLTLAMSCALVPSAVFAPVMAAAQQSAAETGITLEEVLVTAQKREQRLLDVPLSVSAFTESALTDIGANQLADFLQTSPGIGIIDNNSGTQNIQIRGINSTFGNSPVGYYLDELPFTLVGSTRLPDVRTYDLARVEILRGPQGTLYGDGSIGGTVRLLTNEPDLENFDASLDLAGMSSKDGEPSYRAQGMVNAPLADGKAGVRLVATWEDFGGWVDNSSTGVEDQNNREVQTYRGKFRWKPTDRLDMVFSAWHSSQEAVGDADSTQNLDTPLPAPIYDTQYDLYSGTVRYQADTFELISVTSLMDYEEESVTFVAGGFPFSNLTDQTVLSEELRVSSTGGGNFRWTGGLFLRQTERDNSAALPAFNILQEQEADSKAWALFGELTWTLLDERLDATFGLRYFEDELTFNEVLDDGLLGLIQSVDPSFTGAVAETFNTTNPRFNLSYRLTEDWNIYANVAKGFRSGQAQPGISLGLAILSGVQIPSGINPEELWSYEIGAKGSFWGGRATLEAAAYVNDWEDLQVAVVVTPQVRALVNGGTAQTRGVEVALTLLPIENLQLKFSGGYTNAEFTESVEGINISDGDKIPNVPEMTVSLSGTYRWKVGGDLSGFAYAGAQYADERTDTINFALPGDATTRVDARIGVESDSWKAYLFAENLTNEDGAITPLLLGPQGPATRMRPATFGLQVGFQL